MQTQKCKSEVTGKPYKGVFGLLNSIVINSDDYEIQIKRMDLQGWQVVVYKIEHSTKEIYEQRMLKCFDTAYVYVKENYLKPLFEKGAVM